MDRRVFSRPGKRRAAAGEGTYIFPDLVPRLSPRFSVLGIDHAFFPLFGVNSRKVNIFMRALILENVRFSRVHAGGEDA